MTHTEIASQRLYHQQISKKAFERVEDVVRWMVAMQAQDYLASLWAIGLRTSQADSITEPMIEQAIAERKIVRTWPMRGTLHWVATEDVRWLLRLLTPRVIRSSATRYRELALDEGIFLTCRKLFEQALQGGKQLTRSALYYLLEDAGILSHAQRGYHILSYLAQKEVICFGAREGKQPTFALLDEYLPQGKDIEGEEALAELAQRYIQSRGPVSEYDFATWAGLTLTDARKGFESVKNQFDQATVDGQSYYFSEVDTATVMSSDACFLLPAFDEMLCGYKDRSAILKSEHTKSMILKNGILNPSIIIAGKVMGSWKRFLKKDEVLIVDKAFVALNKKQRKTFREAGKQYASFLGLNAVFKDLDVKMVTNQVPVKQK
ncbi:winged helix DNA-binding domain-containing protein [Catalinimonas niigatensis]|uniref:winged helix DNA-binding domain-containing protein n=1 Tax=Catalinimonas niigatensis TaxID=1397264 RepID=UPI002666C6F3|nr:winged helix DNA-binding domain-containing protein [Catalinimonas niigatensis]WPP52877.1 winged helix DNA-binding domain-containing protein [Catalinimonas niigatensis]